MWSPSIVSPPKHNGNELMIYGFRHQYLTLWKNIGSEFHLQWGGSSPHDHKPLSWAPPKRSYVLKESLTTGFDFRKFEMPMYIGFQGNSLHFVEFAWNPINKMGRNRNGPGENHAKITILCCIDQEIKEIKRWKQTFLYVMCLCYSVVFSFILNLIHTSRKIELIKKSAGEKDKQRNGITQE